MHCLIYVSRSLLPSDGRAQLLENLETQAIERNTILDITGFLMASPTFFMELLEGTKSAVDMVMMSIHADPRYETVQVVWSAKIESRRYSNWHMSSYDGEEDESIPTDPLFTACSASNNPDAHVRLDQRSSQLLH